MLFRDPIPTPAARAGRGSVVAGVAGWSLLVLGGALYMTSLASADDANLRASFRVAAGWVLGGAVLAFLTGVIFAASGVTQFIVGPPDPGRALVFAGFALNALPMVLVGMGAAYDKFAPKPKEPRPPALAEPASAPTRP